MIKLIINADDFGYSKIFNERILDLLEKGALKSTTVLVKWVDESQGNQIEHLKTLAESGKIGVGLHLELGMDNPTVEEMESQYRQFMELFGFVPSHIDLHKRIEDEALVKRVSEFAKSKGLPVRNHGFATDAKTTTYPALLCDSWIYGISKYIGYLENAKDGESCEIITHPGDFDPNSKSKLNRERKADYDSVLELNKWLIGKKNIKVISYMEL